MASFLHTISLSPNRSLNSAAVAATIQPPDSSQQPSPPPLPSEKNSRLHSLLSRSYYSGVKKSPSHH
ncbi:hypothetical protein Bca52824_027723 [Brassica carinata]|uniref:Uncharacterized protein n=1 Tax=Brassica carinata TaxID=52824 RepID=A0A8X8ALQ8_BRACI|nr:hypothetical protein Bca52824_027723 [Brassica carinata]